MLMVSIKVKQHKNVIKQPELTSESYQDNHEGS